MHRLIAGPWVGEFGWELMRWQGFLRKAAASYEDVVVSTFDGHEPLYADFCKTFFPHNLTGNRDCLYLRGGDRYAYDSLKEILSKLKGDMVCPTAGLDLKNQRFVKYGTAEKVPSQNRFDVLIHARERQERCPDHNWSRDRWMELCDMIDTKGLRVAAIGTQALCPTGVVDLRKTPLGELMNIMAAAKAVVGPSSGPMHLASLCGTRHIVWTDSRIQPSIAATNRERYEKLWNPLKTPCCVIDSHGWNPPARDIMAAIQEELSVCPKQSSN